MGERRGRPGGRGRADPSERGRAVARAGGRARARDEPRRRGVRRRGGVDPRRGRSLVPLRPDLVGRPRHRALAHAPGGRRRDPRRDRPGVRRRRRPRGGASRDALHGAHARGARGADDVRAQAGGMGVRARSRPGAGDACDRRRPRREAVRRRRPVRRDRSRGRADRLRARRAGAGAELDADPAARPACRGAVRARARRLVARPLRHGDPASRAHGGARGRGALRPRPEGLVGDAAQAEPHHRGADLRARPRRPCQRDRRPGERRAVARARHLALVGRADRRARLVPRARLRARPVRVARGGPGREARAHARQPGVQPRALLQPAAPARPRRERAGSGRGVPPRPAPRDACVGRGARPARARERRMRRSRDESTSIASSTSAPTPVTSTPSSTGSARSSPLGVRRVAS